MVVVCLGGGSIGGGGLNEWFWRIDEYLSTTDDD